MDVRCDCGNSKLPEQCSFLPDKDHVNEGNRYNQNYFGLYCHCKRPYDSDRNVEEKVYMLQCHQCEDWYHNTHLRPPIQQLDLPEEYMLICRNCVGAPGSEFNEALFKHKEHFHQETTNAIEEAEIKEPDAKR